MKLLLFLLGWGAITLRATAELEPNNSVNTANPISQGAVVTGQTASSTDQDWFSFSLATAGIVSVDFDSPETGSFDYHTIQIKSSTGTVFASFDAETDLSFQARVPSAGTFFIVVLDGPSSIASTGQYSISYTANNIFSGVELEPNNSAQSAVAMAPGQPILGQIASATDQDWFSFTVNSAATVTVEFDSPETGSFDYHTVQLSNGTGTTFSSVDMKTDGMFQASVSGPGTYYVVVKDGPSSISSTGTYGVTVTGILEIPNAIIQAELHTAVELTWNSKIGKTYTIEWSPSMATGSWVKLSGSYMGTGSPLSYLDSTRTKPRGFYRIKES